MLSNKNKFNKFLMLKLPSAWLCGVRLNQIDDNTCKVSVRHTWINQNPFNSMYFAVQAMAAELSTGALVMEKIQQSSREISMLVVKNHAKFTKKATGKINFYCYDGPLIDQAIKKTMATGEGQRFWMKSTAINDTGQQIAVFEFEWSIKIKQEI